MKFIKTAYLSILLLLFSQSINSQNDIDKILDNEEVKSIIDSISSLVIDNYISIEMGMQMSDSIKINQKNGLYNNMSYNDLSKVLTNDLRSVSGDVHMSTYYNNQRNIPQETVLSKKNDKSGSMSNYGFVEIKILEDNIGYLKISHFTKWNFFNAAKIAIDNSLGVLQNTDALIIDVRSNPGGFEDIVAYLVSYFHDNSNNVLQEYFCRYQDSKSNIKITEELPNKKLLEPSIYILVNKRTGSAAESFAYIMKHLDRATVVGETTIGAGNGSRSYQVSNNFFVQISVCETINNVTKKSWEKVGVIPHIETTSDEAYNKALELAMLSSKKHRLHLTVKYKLLLDSLNAAVMETTSDSTGETLINKMIECQELNLIVENDINNLGYEFLMRHKNSVIAEKIFKTNTVLYSNSANVYDSYAEALVVNKKLDEAITNYRKAVDLAVKNNHPNLELFKKSLYKLEEKKN